jgi:pyruvate/2-oxoglutarate dehydrogenase complex dihydrolipoamide acyltransferase (E2) component
MEMPLLNAMIDLTSKEIVYRDYVDVSVAVQGERGLVVPVLRDTDKMTFAVSVFDILRDGIMMITVFIGTGC